MTTLMESGAPKCSECQGYGLVTRCGHMGACPCDGEPCPVCEGSRVAPCDDCGEPAVVRYSGTNYCDECRPGEEREFSSCSICDVPLDMTERGIPLCDRCDSTARAHADLIRAEREWVADGRPD